MTGLVARLRPRTVVRGAFFLFFVYLCVKLWLFYLWTIGAGAYVPRPEAVAGLIPVGAYMSFFAWVKTGVYDPVLPAGVTIIVGALLTSLLFKRGFCGFICPVGAFWESLGWLGGRVLPRQFHAPRWLDLGLRGLRYALAFGFVAILFVLPVSEAVSFQQLPYYAVADIKILSLFVLLPLWYVGIGVTVGAASFFFGNVWCRYVCPLGGIYGAVGVLSPSNVVRDPDTCIDCGACSKTCHALVDVQHLETVRAPECDGCQTCVESCPVPGALEGRALGRIRITPWGWAGLVVALWVAVYAVASFTGHWTAGLNAEAFRQAVQNVRIQ
jgi:polyferredoxin